ncbi:MAG: murein biosynthesis integral membrane protein MurJ [Proteobacteria bacterium]|nr:murein biosynthesis integral membrane protein MurJ [Pseudomonadota bacterium]
MFRSFATVGGLTLISRATGFLRDIMLAALIGAGPMADAFFVALRLPNHFRAIFAEGAFNAAFVPAYARVRERGGANAAGLFAGRVFTMLFAVQLALLGAALAATPTVITLLAPGFASDPARFALAVEFTRITFPYLLLVTLVTLYGGMLNVLGRFATAAAAPILLNLSMMATLALAVFFPTIGHAAAWGVLLAGCLEVALVGADAARCGVLPALRRVRLDDDVMRFLKAFAPATLGSAGTQLALFADTIIASMLAAGAVSALYYADRISQLPIGVIGIAAGTVLLPAMASRIAGGDEDGARHIQSRAIELTLLLALPCFVAFLLVPLEIMQALFQRGAFTHADATAAAATLLAYAIGLFPFVLIRSVAASFIARGDTATPVRALFAAVIVNVALKVMLMHDYAQVGLAFATSVGAWINLLLLLALGLRSQKIGGDKRLLQSIVRLAIAGGALALALAAARHPLSRLVVSWPNLRAEMTLAGLVVVGAVVYGAAIAALFGRQWRELIRLRRQSPPAGEARAD